MARSSARALWEWCCSRYDDYPHSAEQVRDDFADNMMGAALRGGAYHMQDNTSGWSARAWYFPNLKHAFQGFRVVVSRSLWG